MEFVARCEDNGGEKQIEEELVVKADGAFDEIAFGKVYDQPSDHTCALLASSIQICCYHTRGVPTSEDGEDRLMHRLNLLML